MSARSRQVVTGFGLLRVGLGVAFLVAPRRLGRSADVLMTRSFAVRELVLGIGGVRGAATAPELWAGLGVLVDAGDAVSAAIAMKRRAPHAGWALLTAVGGLGAEAWALQRLRHETRAVAEP